MSLALFDLLLEVHNRVRAFRIDLRRSQLSLSSVQERNARTWKTFCWRVLTVIFIVMVVVSGKRGRQPGRGQGGAYCAGAQRLRVLTCVHWSNGGSIRQSRSGLPLPHPPGSPPVHVPHPALLPPPIAPSLTEQGQHPTVSVHRLRTSVTRYSRQCRLLLQSWSRRPATSTFGASRHTSGRTSRGSLLLQSPADDAASPPRNLLYSTLLAGLRPTTPHHPRRGQ